MVTFFYTPDGANRGMRKVRGCGPGPAWTEVHTLVFELRWDTLSLEVDLIGTASPLLSVVPPGNHNMPISSQPSTQ